MELPGVAPVWNKTARI